VPLLTDPVGLVRQSATDALGDVGRASGRLAGTSLDALARGLGDEYKEVQVASARALAGLGDRRCLPLLLEWLRKPGIRFHAAEALGHSGLPEGVAPLERVGRKLFFVHPLERLAIAAALVRLGRSDWADYIRGATRSRRQEERGYALVLLGELKLDGAYDQLAAVLHKPDDYHRDTAAEGLGLLGDVRAVPLLAAVLAKAQQPDLVHECARALHRIDTADARLAIDQAWARAKAGGHHPIAQAIDDARRW
jgi:HEAT repeat protein